jgi:hypothetical protein
MIGPEAMPCDASRMVGDRRHASRLTPEPFPPILATDRPLPQPSQVPFDLYD